MPQIFDLNEFQSLCSTKQRSMSVYFHNLVFHMPQIFDLNEFQSLCSTKQLTRLMQLNISESFQSNEAKFSLNVSVSV